MKFNKKNGLEQVKNEMIRPPFKDETNIANETRMNFYELNVFTKQLTSMNLGISNVQKGIRICLN